VVCDLSVREASVSEAISGTRRQYKEMADGTIRVSIDIDPPFKSKFLELFGEIDMPVALAPLKADFEKPAEEEKPKGGPLSISAARMCEYAPYIAFMKQEYVDLWDRSGGDVAEMQRQICSIESRAELDSNPEAAKKFKSHMRFYNEWNTGK
jgi:hypothetical protein